MPILHASNAVRLTAVSLFLLSAIGCSVTYGEMPKVERLEELKRQISTKEDVLKVLGAPRGYGMADLGTLPGARPIWFYEYAHGGGSQIELTILLVFFEGEKYDGYLWFSASQEVKGT